MILLANDSGIDSRKKAKNSQGLGIAILLESELTQLCCLPLFLLSVDGVNEREYSISALSPSPSPSVSLSVCFLFPSNVFV